MMGSKQRWKNILYANMQRLLGYWVNSSVNSGITTGHTTDSPVRSFPRRRSLQCSKAPKKKRIWILCGTLQTGHFGRRFSETLPAAKATVLALSPCSDCEARILLTICYVDQTTML